jgi:hypothetical protein
MNELIKETRKLIEANIANGGGKALEDAMVELLGEVTPEAAPAAKPAIKPAAYWGVYHVNGNGEATLCEIDGGICYEAYRSKRSAEQSARRSNYHMTLWNEGRAYYQDYDESHFEVRPIPAGVRVWDKYSDTEGVSGEHNESPYVPAETVSRMVLWFVDEEADYREITDIIEQDYSTSEFMAHGLGADFLRLARQGYICATHYQVCAGYHTEDGNLFPWFPTATLSRI